jgi:hypothetical protein
MRGPSAAPNAISEADIAYSRFRNNVAVINIDWPGDAANSSTTYQTPISTPVVGSLGDLNALVRNRRVELMSGLIDDQIRLGHEQEPFNDKLPFRKKISELFGGQEIGFIEHLTRQFCIALNQPEW